MTTQPHNPQAVPAKGPLFATRAELAATLAGAGGAVLIIIGSLMPWATATTVFGTLNFAGTDGDGQLTLILGILLAALAGLAGIVRHLLLRIINLAAAISIVVLAVYEIANVSDAAAQASSEFARASVGTGLYVLLLGALVTSGAAATLAALQRKPASTL